MKAIDPRKQFEYVPECERALPESERVVAVIKGLTLSDETAIKDALYSGTHGISISLAGQQRMALSVGLVDLKNFKDRDGVLIPVTRDKNTGLITDEFLFRIPYEVRSEIARVILESLNATGDELKN